MIHTLYISSMFIVQFIVLIYSQILVVFITINFRTLSSSQKNTSCPLVTMIPSGPVLSSQPPWPCLCICLFCYIIAVELYMWSPVTGFFHFTVVSRFRLQHVPTLNSFLRLNIVPLFRYATFCFFVYQLMAICFVLLFWLQALLYRLLWEHMFSFFMGVYTQGPWQ